MNITFLTNGYPPRQWAGTETYTRSLAEQLTRSGHDVRVACVGDWDRGPSYWGGEDDAIINGVRVRWLNVNWTRAPDPCGYLYDNPVMAEYVRSFLSEGQPDLVHVTSCYSLSASVLHVVKELGLPLVLTLTDFWFLCPRLNLVRGDGSLCDGRTTPWECLRCMLWDSRAYRVARMLLPEAILAPVLTQASQRPALSRHAGLRGLAMDMGQRKAFLREAIGMADRVLIASRFAQEMFKINDIRVPIAIAPYGLDLSWRDERLGKTPSKAVRFGYVGRLDRSKGAHLLVQAFTRLPQDGRAELLVYGNLAADPAYAAELRAYAAGRADIRFCGTYDHADSAKIYAAIDVLVVPSLWFDFPLVVQEAISTETPVIASDVGSMREAIEDGVNGLLFQRGDIGALAAALRRCIYEPGLLRRLRPEPNTVRTIEQEVDELQKTYEQLNPRGPRDAMPSALEGTPCGQR